MICNDCTHFTNEQICRIGYDVDFNKTSCFGYFRSKFATDTDQTVLDSSFQRIDINPVQNIDVVCATHSQRFTNHIIDSIAVFIIIFIFSILLSKSGMMDPESNLMGVINIILILSYYTIMEISTGQTIGKMITNTIVVSHDGSEPTIKQIIGRSFARMIPFEVFSFFGNPSVGWHDQLSKTRVISKYSVSNRKPNNDF